MNHTEIINKLIEKNNFKSYLEIGLDNPNLNFTQINCELKHSVDPFFEEDHKEGCDISVSEFEEAFKYLTHRMTSDEFFKTSTDKYDIIFVDGLHTEGQAGKDIINGLKHLNKGGYIVVHDCLPYSYEAQVVPRITGGWNGDVWKCIPELEKQFIDFEVVDCDFGCGIIKYNDDYENLHYLDKSIYTWNDFVEHRNKLMHVISEEEFTFEYLVK